MQTSAPPISGPAGRIRRLEASAYAALPPAALFERLDDQTRLGEHMAKPSAMMGGGKMTYEFDEGGGRKVGSHIRMGGSAFGLTLFADEVVTERTPPRRKTWRTTGTPKLVVIAGYEMGFNIEPAGAGSRLTVWINYQLAKGPLAVVAGPWLGAMYARWCVERMVADAAAGAAGETRAAA